MKIIFSISAVIVLLVLILAVHIYVVTRPHVANVRSRAMARIDLHQTISRTEADSITAWLYRQKGVDQVLVNPGSSIAVFTFAPAAVNANQIVRAFQASLPYAKAARYLPTGAQVKRGCPMTATPVTNKLYMFLKKLF